MMKAQCLSLVLLFAVQVLQAEPETYEIKLSRPTKVGEKFRTVVRGEESAVSKGAGRPDESFKTTVDLTAVVEVLETDAKSLPRKASFTIEQCFVTNDQGRKELLSKDRVILVSAEHGKKNISADRGELSAEARQALNLVLTVHTGDADDDQIFGTSKPRKVGDRWPINVDVAVAEFGRNAQVNRNDVSGSTQLTGITNVHGIKCLELFGQVKVANIKSIAGSRTMDMTTTLKKVLPVDSSHEAVTESVSMKYSSRGKTRLNGEEKTFERTGERRLDATYFDLK